MKTAFAALTFVSLAIFVSPLRRLRMRPAVAAPAPVEATPVARTLDAETLAAMQTEADRIASPFKQHIRSLRAAPETEDFSEVEALLQRAGLLA